MNPKNVTIDILGAGASGLTAAVFAAKACPNAKITVIEHNAKAGRKLLATGNGKCNLTNSVMAPKCYRTGSDPELIDSVLRRFGTTETKEFFRNLGLLLKQKNGYWYPNSEQAASVTKALLLTCRSLGVTIRTNTEVQSLSVYNGYFRLSLKETLYEKAPKKGKGKPGKPVPCGTRETTEQPDFVINCLGGPAGQNLGAGFSGTEFSETLGLSVTKMLPALTALRLQEPFLELLSGVRKECSVTLTVTDSEGNRISETETGEILFTDYGISGIAVMQLSGLVSRYPDGNPMLSVNLFPEYSDSERNRLVKEQIGNSGLAGRTAEEAFTGWLPNNLLYCILKKLEIDPEKPVTSLSEKETERFTEILGKFPLTVLGTNGFSQAQAAFGGVKLSEVTDELEAKACPGYFLAGEVLDCTGKCGGYNLQWAWATGAISGTACGKRALSRLEHA